MSAQLSPQDVHAFWLADTPETADGLAAAQDRWFKGGKAFDEELTDRFLPLLETLAAGPMAYDWAAQGARGRLSALIVLDQMSRNIFRGSPRAFAQDHLALHLCKEGLLRREDLSLSETERVFYYLPLEHAEAIVDQERSVDLFAGLHADARPAYRAFTEETLDYARQHLDAIRRFGRFAHRNVVVGRTSSAEEIDWLAEGGGF